jgi:spermidine/putrescine transport system substrate-binding protein
MDEEYTENPAIFPTDEIIAKSEASIYLGEGPIRLRDEAWTRIQAA